MRTVAESKIEKTIDEIREYIDTCKTVPLMGGKIMVNKDELDELLDELEENVPEEVRKSRDIVSKYDEIISEAETQAKRKLDETGNEIKNMLSENEILLQAYAQADEVVAQAAAQAQQIINSAHYEAEAIKGDMNQYLDSMLQKVENIITSAIQTNDRKFRDMQSNLDEYYQVILSNRQELVGNASDNNTDGDGTIGGATGEINIDMM